MLAALLAAGVAAMALQTAAAAAETPKADHQPYMHGYNVDQIKSWSPETDRFAKYFRSRVPLAERIPAFAPTQANPALSAEPQVMNLSADYDKEAFFRGVPLQRLLLPEFAELLVLHRPLRVMARAPGRRLFGDESRVWRDQPAESGVYGCRAPKRRAQFGRMVLAQSGANLLRLGREKAGRIVPGSG